MAQMMKICRRFNVRRGAKQGSLWNKTFSRRDINVFISYFILYLLLYISACFYGLLRSDMAQMNDKERKNSSRDDAETIRYLC